MNEQVSSRGYYRDICAGKTVRANANSNSTCGVLNPVYQIASRACGSCLIDTGAADAWQHSRLDKSHGEGQKCEEERASRKGVEERRTYFIAHRLDTVRHGYLAGEIGSCFAYSSNVEQD